MTWDSHFRFIDKLEFEDTHSNSRLKELPFEMQTLNSIE